MNSRLSGHNIIYFTTRDWDSQRGTQEQIMSRLAKTNKVLVIESAISPLAILDRPYLGKRIIRSLKGVRKNGNLFIYTFPMVLPFGNTLPFIKKINFKIELKFIRRIMEKLKIHDPIHIIIYPYFIDFVGKLGEKMVIAYFVDDSTAEIKDPAERQALQKKIRYLCKKADIVLTTSTALYNEMKHFNKNTFFVPNGVDANHFMKALLPETRIPDSIRNISKPIVGFMGIIDNRLDVPLMLKLAKNHPKWSIVFVGKVKKKYVNIAALKKLKNVHFLGMQKPEDLPAFIKAFDVCLIPYVDSQLTRNIYPLKLHEYLATGKPVVSTNMPELYPFKEVVRISKDYKEFEDNIIKSLKEDKEENKLKRIAIAKQNTWDNRIETISKIISKFLNNLDFT